MAHEEETVDPELDMSETKGMLARTLVGKKGTQTWPSLLRKEPGAQRVRTQLTLARAPNRG